MKYQMEIIISMDGGPLEKKFREHGVDNIPDLEKKLFEKWKLKEGDILKIKAYKR